MLSTIHEHQVHNDITLEKLIAMSIAQTHQHDTKV